MQTSWRRLKNNRSELFLTFVVPVIFFSIFALIFGSRDSSSSTPKIKVAIANAHPSELSNKAVLLLGEQKSLRISEHANSTKAGDSKTTVATLDRATAEDLVRRGMVSAAIVFSKPTDQALPNNAPKIEILTDSFDQVASQVLAAIVQKAMLTATAEIAKSSNPINGSAMNGIPNAAMQPVDVQHALYTRANSSGSAITPSNPLIQSPDTMSMLPQVAVVDVIGGKKTNPVVAMYAAGIAVMFLLFSATTASGSLLEERENSTLDRLLCSRLTMDQLLLGKWAFLTAIGATQLTLMFVWGSLVFGIDLLHHLEGFAAMTLVTSGAASSFALMLAALCKTRMQLGWVSTIVILSMSALGGSMVPRYLMSETIQRAGLLTFNAWALEGFNKVFWREMPLTEIGTELAVLTVCGFGFIVAARVFAIRWERS
jgi:ABC-2 type transport system permease protein